MVSSQLTFTAETHHITEKCQNGVCEAVSTTPSEDDIRQQMYLRIAHGNRLMDVEREAQNYTRGNS